jgi:hypothetical protein
VLGSVLNGGQKAAQVRPETDIDVSTAPEGRHIPVVFGTRLMTGPSIVWWGDLRTSAIKSSGGKK